MGLEAETEMDGELAGEGVTHLVASAAEGCIKGLVVVADAVVGKHQVDGLLGADGEITTEARLKVEAVGHLDLVGTETNIFRNTFHSNVAKTNEHRIKEMLCLRCSFVCESLTSFEPLYD